MEVRKIKIDSYDYVLPQERIALHPLSQRDSCKLLSAKSDGRISHLQFSDLPLLVSSGTLIIANETKVIRARLEFRKESGARIEIFLLEPLRPHDYVTSFATTRQCSWKCLVGNKKKWKNGSLVMNVAIPSLGKTVSLYAESCGQIEGGGVEILFRWDNEACSFAEIVEAAGNIPIPPYLNRQSEESDATDYQTVYSRTQGSVAAPTAGLHFTPELIDRLKQHGDEFSTVTLHVGAGTFQPVKTEEIGGHPMHTEWISVSRQTLGRLINALQTGRDILAVGTTSVRTLESLPYIGVLLGKGIKVPVVEQWMPYESEFSRIDTIRALKNIYHYLEENSLGALETTTSIMIAPGFRWRIVNRLITNFHQPKSTLLLLVSSFLGNDSAGRERWRNVYEEALEKGYRFLSYGDACLFPRGRQPVELPLAKSMLLRGATIRAALDPEALLSEGFNGLCDDSALYIEALKDTLLSVDLQDDKVKNIYIGEGAAPLRFLIAFASSLAGSKIRITCGPGLQKRPVLPLVETMVSLGADIRFNFSPADWHIEIRGKRLKGGRINVESSYTSQFISALMLASELWEEGGEIVVEDNTVSLPYVRMTEEMIRHHLVKAEPDWSSASYFYEYCLVTGKSVVISALTPPSDSLQGDSACCRIFRMMGVETDFQKTGEARLRFNAASFRETVERGVFEYDFNEYPDLVPAVAVALCSRRLPFRLTGIAHLRFKECDRLIVLQQQLMRLGFEISVERDALSFSGVFHPMEDFPVEIDPHGDHRMAMAFYPLELTGMALITDKKVVSKSFPDFYQQFK